MIQMTFKQLINPRISGFRVEGGMCLQAVQNSFNTEHPYATAMAQWNGAGNKYTGKAPDGLAVPVFFSLGGEPAGHVAVMFADGRVGSSTRAGVYQSLYMHPNLDDLIKVYRGVGWNIQYLGWKDTVGTQKVVTNEENNTMIQNNDSEYARWNDLHWKVRNKTISRELFNNNFVGQDERSIMDSILNNPEADLVQNWQIVGRLAVTEDWQGQIKELTEQVKNGQGSAKSSDSEAKLKAIKEALGIS